MFNKLKEMLEAGKISESVANELDSEISKALKELRDEAASYRVKYQEVHKNYEEVLKSKENFENELKNIDEKLTKAKEEGKKELIKELEAQKKEKEELIKKLKEAEATSKRLKIENALNKTLKEYEVIDFDVVSAVLKNNLDVVEDEVKFSDGKSLAEGVKEFFEAKPHLLKPKGNNGSGAGNEGQNFNDNTLTAQLLSKLKR